VENILTFFKFSLSSWTAVVRVRVHLCNDDTAGASGCPNGDANDEVMSIMTDDDGSVSVPDV